MYLGIDIGGTKTLLAAFDDEGNITEKVKFPSTSYQDFLQNLETELQKFESRDFKYGAIGMPGSMDREKGISTWSGSNLTWGETRIVQDVATITGCNMLIENDANAAGLGEAVLVKDQYSCALYLTISTGIGGVLVVDGSIDQRTINAEVGHMIFKQPDGSYQTWEQLASGKTMVAKFGQRADEISDPEIWKIVTEPIAMGIINLCAVLTPDVIIIGGGAGANLHRFQNYLEDWIEQLKPAAVTVPPLLEARHPEEAVVYGCYELAMRAHENATH